MSAMSAGLRAVTAACQPRARTASASSRPKPVEQPVISHVCIIFPRFGFRDERARRHESSRHNYFRRPQSELLAERADFRRRVLPLIRRSSRIPRWPSEALGMNLPGVDDQAGRLALDALHVGLGDLGGG